MKRIGSRGQGTGFSKNETLTTEPKTRILTPVPGTLIFNYAYHRH
jgi:hypothetical protein